MPQILANVTAMQASRQLGVSNAGLQKAIQRLTTGKRVNNASDDAAGMVAGTAATALARSSAQKVIADNNNYFQAQSSDGFLEEATNQALRLAELEGQTGGSTSAEYTAVQSLYQTAAAAGGASTAAVTDNSSTALGIINTQRSSIAATMATAQSNANMDGITAEGQTNIANSIMGADIGSETVNLTKFQILMQAGTSALSQANQSSQSILALFR